MNGTRRPLGTEDIATSKFGHRLVVPRQFPGLKSAVVLDWYSELLTVRGAPRVAVCAAGNTSEIRVYLGDRKPLPAYGSGGHSQSDLQDCLPAPVSRFFRQQGQGIKSLAKARQRPDSAKGRGRLSPENV